MAEIKIRVGGDGTGFFALQNKIEARSKVTAALLSALTKKTASEEIREIQRVASVEEATRRNRARALLRERAERRAAAAEAAKPPVITPTVKPSVAGQLGGQFLSGAAGRFGALVGAAAIEQAVARTVRYGGEIDDLTKKTGASAKALQEWAYVANQNGATLDDVANSFRGLSKARQDAIGNPGGDSEKAFGMLGISPFEVKNDSQSQIFGKIASAFNANDFGGGEEALIGKVLGRSGTSMLASFKDDFGALVDEANRLGFILEDSVVSNLDKIGDAVSKVTAMFRVPLASAILFVANAITGITNMLGAQARMMGHISAAATSNPLTKSGRNQIREALKLASAEASNANPFKAFGDAFKDSEEEQKKDASRTRTQRPGWIDPEIKEEKEEKKAKTPFSMSADASTRIGGFIGGTNPGIIADILGRQQLAAQQQIARNTAELLAWMRSRNFTLDDEGSL